MKSKVLLFFIILLGFYFPGFTQSNMSANGKKTAQHIVDTIEFSLRWAFTGDCGNDCYKFIGTGVISKINGKTVDENCDHLFLKCPSGFKLNPNTSHRFEATYFTPNNCSTVIDTCTNSSYYLLVKEIN